MEAVASLLAAAGSDAGRVAASAAVDAEGQFAAYLIDSVQAIAVGICGLINELKAERFCTTAALIAIARQKFCDYEKLQRYFIEAAEGL